jgi:hypothetical protein
MLLPGHWPTGAEAEVDDHRATGCHHDVPGPQGAVGETVAVQHCHLGVQLRPTAVGTPEA